MAAGNVKVCEQTERKTQRPATKENRVSEGEGEMITVRLRRTRTHEGTIN